MHGLLALKRLSRLLRVSHRLEYTDAVSTGYTFAGARVDGFLPGQLTALPRLIAR